MPVAATIGDVKLTVNGADVEVDDRHAKTPLLWVLRDVLGLRGTKFGCGAGFCAACTVLIDGRNIEVVPDRDRAGGRQARHHRRRRLGACGRRGPRRLASRQRRAVRVLPARADARGGRAARVGRSPDDATIRRWMNGNLCRCGTYPRIRDAIHEAAETLAAGDRARTAERARRSRRCRP